MKFRAHQLVDALKAGTVNRQADMPDIQGEIISLLEDAQCFYAGEMEDFERNRIVDLDSPFAKLPFPITYVEFEAYTLGTICLLATESGDEILLTIFTKEPGKGFSKNLFDIVLKGQESHLSVTMPGFEIDDLMRQYAGNIAQIFVSFLEALNCSNVETILNEPPQKLNKKRIAKGKTPLFAFRTLHIKTGQRTVTPKGQTAAERAGPRLHFRRGHIRRLPDKLVWVQPCMVGSIKNGMVLKDYEVF
jgi:hypothetical protein